MTRVRVLAALTAAGALTLAGVGCGTGTPPPRTPPTTSAPTVAATSAPPRVTASASAAVSPTPPPTDSGIVFAADGIGPYVIGTPLTDLQSSAQITGVTDSPSCLGTTTAAATGRYAGALTLFFTAGRLASVRTSSNILVTPAGAKVGMSLADAQTLYGGRGDVITATTGSKALELRVTATTLALLLYLDPSNTTVVSMSGGEAAGLETSARIGSGC